MALRHCGSAARWAFLLGFTGAFPLFAQQTPLEDDCVVCHLSLEEDSLRLPAELFSQDVHADRGFDCLSCHGRIEEGPQGLDTRTGFLARPDRQQVSRLCGQCHSDAEFMRDYNPAIRVDQETEFATSGHGRALMEENDPDVATCVSCHPAHAIRPPDDPESSVHALNVADLCASCHADEGMMARHDLGTEQIEEYRTSVHGRLMFEEDDATAPTCNDCHGNHGAAPPGISSVQNVCGQCHVMMSDFFAASGHVEIFEEEALPGCATCHEHHAIEETNDELLADRSETVCATCHEASDESGREFVVMKALIDSLELEAERSRELLLDAEDSGMEVSQALFELEDVNNALVKARTAIHALQLDPVQQEIDTGLETAAAAFERGEEALWEHWWFRRAGLGVSAVIILGLVLALLLKIRHIEVRVEEMLTAVEAFFLEAMTGAAAAEGAITAERLRMAACALMIELAYADEEFSAAERLHLEELIRRRFQLDAQQADRLIQLVAEQREGGVDLGQFTSLINRHYTVEEKHSLLDAMWGLVLSDGELAEHERRFMNEITRRLGMEAEWGERTRSGPMRRWMSLFFGAMRGRSADAAPGDFEDLHLAACALLVELVYVDEDFAEAERRHLEGLLQRQFGLGGVQADRLIRLTEQQREAGVNIEQLAGIIAQHYSREDRMALVDAMWSLVLADGVLAEREKEYVTRIMDLLGVEPAWVTTRELPDRPQAGNPEDPS
jgi:predicted CXXCH cytochrome family protein